MSLATFIHIGDAHLSSATGARNADRLAALDQIIDEGLGLRTLAAWLWPGDLFHGRSSIDDRNALATRLIRMADRAPVVICYGNHDLPGDLDIFGELAATHVIRVISTPQVIQQGLATGGPPASLFVLPWQQQTTTVELVAVFEDAAARLAGARADGRITLMMGHANLRGAVRGPGQPAVGEEAELSASLLDTLGPCPKLLNHIHKAQAVGGAMYAGSICRLNWGEVEPKVYGVVTFSSLVPPTANGAQVKDLLYNNHVTVPPLYHVECWLTPNALGFHDMHATAGPDGEHSDGPPFGDWAGVDVRVRARYKQSEAQVLERGQAAVKALFTRARRFEFEPICVPDRGLRAPAVAVAVTFAEKLAAWAEVAGVDLPAHVADKADALTRPDPDAVVATVEAQMTALANLAAVEDAVAVEEL